FKGEILHFCGKRSDLTNQFRDEIAGKRWMRGEQTFNVVRAHNEHTAWFERHDRGGARTTVKYQFAEVVTGSDRVDDHFSTVFAGDECLDPSGEEDIERICFVAFVNDDCMLWEVAHDSTRCQPTQRFVAQIYERAVRMLH